MVGRLLSAVMFQTRGLHEAAYVVATFALLSQLLALVRDRLLAGQFGAGGVLDLYYSAFRIPDLLFATIASLLSLYALLPVLSRLQAEKEGLVLSFMRQALWWFFISMALISGGLFFLAPKLIALIAPGIAHDTEAFPQLLLLTRILLLQPILLGASNILANLTQLRHRFLLYSIGPLLYNAGIIAGIVYLYPHMGLAGLGWGVVAGAALHFLVQVPFFAAERSIEPLPMRRMFSLLKEVLGLSIPRTLTLAASQISLLVIVAMASLRESGSIAVFSFAFNLQAAPLTIIGVSYSVAAFPTLARLFSIGDTEEFTRHVTAALRHILFWSVPATVLIIVLRAQIVRTILGSGVFDWSATRLTSAALALLVLSLFAQSAMLVISRAYYAAGKTLKPLFLAALSVSVSILSSVALLAAYEKSVFLQDFFESLLRVEHSGDTGVLMLALGYALGPLCQVAGGLYLLSRDFHAPVRDLRVLFLQSVTASVIGGAGAYGVMSWVGQYLNINTTLGIFLQGLCGGLFGLLMIGIVLLLLKNRELHEIFGALTERFKPQAPALEPTDIAS